MKKVDRGSRVTLRRRNEELSSLLLFVENKQNSN